MISATITLTREQLYERVWSKPVREVAAELGISDVGLAKACRRSGIPLPRQGYWISKHRRQNQRSKPPLPVARQGERIQFEFHPPTPEAQRSAHAERDELRVRLAQLGNMEHLQPPIERVIKAARQTLRKRVDERGIMVGSGKLPWPVRTSPPLAERALAVLTQLLARLHYLGWEIHAARDWPGMAILAIHGREYWVWLEEHSGRIERELTAKELAEKKLAEKERRYFYAPERWVFTPNGRLHVKLDHAGYSYARLRWGERGNKKIEERLDEIAIDIVQFAADEKREVDLQAKRAADREALVMRERERLQRLAHERLKRSALLRETHFWQRATRLHQYIDVVEAAPLATLPHFETELARRRWITWARSIAAGLNPLDSGSAGEVPSLPALPELPWNYRLS